MINKILVGILVVGVIAGGYFTLKNTKGTENTGSENQGKKMAFDAFLTNDSGAYVCTVRQNIDNTESVGTIYLSNVAEGAKPSERSIRGEFKNTVNGIEIDSMFIVKDGVSYTWTSATPGIGYKIPITQPIAESATSIDTTATYGFDTTQIGDYDCKEWIIEPGKFTLPASVNFMDLPMEFKG